MSLEPKPEPDGQLGSDTNLDTSLTNSELAPLDEEKSRSSEDEASVEAATSNVNLWDPNQFPDGGIQAWIVVAGATAGVFCTFGWVNCIGIFQDYYQTHWLSSYSASTISWIASLELFFQFSGSIIVGRLYDLYGPRYLVLVGTFLHVFGLMMLSLSTKYYQILLSQGVCSPLGTCCLFGCCVNVVSTWFLKRRALALGIVAAGSSVGGVIFPIMIDHLIKEVGFGWAIRIAAFMILGLLILTNLTARSRLPPRPREVRLVDYVRPLTEIPYLLTTIAAIFFYLGLFLPINYIQVQGTADGMSPALAAYLIPILNGASVFGRVGGGWFGDRFGRFNMQTIICTFSGIITLALWLPASSNAPVLVYAALYGIGSGGFISLLPPMVAQISDVKEIGVRIGTLLTIASIPGMVSNPIGGAFISRDNGKFTDLQIWCGLVLLVGSAFFMAARVSLVGRKVIKKV